MVGAIGRIKSSYTSWQFDWLTQSTGKRKVPVSRPESRSSKPYPLFERVYCPRGKALLCFSTIAVPFRVFFLVLVLSFESVLVIQIYIYLYNHSMTKRDNTLRNSQIIEHFHTKFPSFRSWYSMKQTIYNRRYRCEKKRYFCARNSIEETERKASVYRLGFSH